MGKYRKTGKCRKTEENIRKQEKTRENIRKLRKTGGKQGEI